MEKKKLSKRKIEGKLHFYVDGVEVNSGQWQIAYANNHGYKNPYHMMVEKGYKNKPHREKYLLHEEFQVCPDEIKEIPSAPGYFATREGVIWCYSNKRKAWIVIKQYSNPKNNGYCSLQPYIDGKKYIKYAHRLIAEAFHGEIPEGYEVNHKDRDVTNNCIDNLEILPMNVHRALRRNRKSKKNLVA